MPDDLTKHGKPDATRINTRESHEVDYWTQELNVTEEELLTAVEVVGPMVKDVKKHLNRE